MVSIKIHPLNHATSRLTGSKAMSLSSLVADLPPFTDSTMGFTNRLTKFVLHGSRPVRSCQKDRELKPTEIHR